MGQNHDFEKEKAWQTQTGWPNAFCQAYREGKEKLEDNKSFFGVKKARFFITFRNK